MKSKIKIFLSALLAVGLFLAGCTNNFENINQKIGEPNHEQMMAGNYKLGAFFPQIINYVYPSQENAYQMTENLIGDPYGRYLSIANNWATNFSTFNAPDGWIAWPFENVYSNVLSAFFQIEKLTKGDGALYQWAKLLKVAALHRLTDMYGPIPYSKITAGNISVQYDDQETLYKAMFKDLDEAIEILTDFTEKNPDYRGMATFDNVYNGNLEKWVKFANSLKLRMAMRIRYADPALAKTLAESAVNQKIGVILSKEDNAQNNYPTNPVWMMTTAWGDSRACADIICYMKGYNDPRLEKYFTKSSAKKKDAEKEVLIEGNDFYGLRTGITIPSKAWADNFSSSTYAQTDRIMIMNAAELAFLKAEAALIGWNMNGKTAKELYEEGIKLSFDQWGAGGAENYIDNSTDKPSAYDIPDFLLYENANLNLPAQSDITIKWDDAADEERKLERIMTQKWIAMYPLGQEAWSEQRRTGYPKFFEVQINASSDPALKTKFASRIPYPSSEKNNNVNNYNDALSKLGGEDSYSTKLWWDKKPNK